MEQTSTNPQQISLFPYNLQLDNTSYFNSLHSSLLNQFKEVNSKKCLQFWSPNSDSAHKEFILTVNCKWIWMQNFSHKNLGTHYLSLCCEIQYFASFLFVLIQIKYPFTNRQVSMII